MRIETIEVYTSVKKPKLDGNGKPVMHEGKPVMDKDWSVSTGKVELFSDAKELRSKLDDVELLKRINAALVDDAKVALKLKLDGIVKHKATTTKKMSARPVAVNE